MKRHNIQPSLDRNLGEENDNSLFLKSVFRRIFVILMHLNGTIIHTAAVAVSL